MQAILGYLARLWRQGVPQVGAIYLLVGWGLYQIAVTVEAAWGLPAFVDIAAAILLTVGFLPVLVTAWTARHRASPTSNTLAAPSASGKPTLAILPFANLSREDEDEIFADGVVEDLTAGLSLDPNLVVISRSSTFAYKDRPADIRQVGADLGARFVLEGSVRRAGAQLRITAQLIDAQSGSHIWAERYDRPLDELFQVQDELVLGIGAALGAAIDQAQLEHARRNPSSVSAWLEAARATALHERPSLAGLADAIGHARKAIALDPDYAMGHIRLALALATQTQMHGIAPGSPMHAESYAHVQTALGLAPHDTRVLGTACSILSHLGYPLEGLPHGLRAAELNPHDATIYGSIGNAYLRMGQAEKAFPYYEMEERLAPKSMWLNARYLYRGLAHISLNHPAEAAAILYRSVVGDPSYAQAWAALAAAEHLRGEGPAAVAAVRKVRALAPPTDMEFWARAIAMNIPGAMAANAADAFRAAWRASEPRSRE